ncbi:MAG: TM2 domain-containing protein, partial [Campylobacterales bacterium]
MGYIKKSRVASLVLCFFFGMLGVHRFYLGKNSSGAIMLILTL